MGAWAAGNNALTAQQVAAAEALSARAEYDPALMPQAYALDAQRVDSDFVDTLSHPALSVPLVLQAWSLQDAWLRWQTAKRSLDARGYESVLEALDADLDAVAVDLTPDTTLISTTEHGIGHVVVIKHPAGGSSTLWRIDEDLSPQAHRALALATRHTPDAHAAQELDCWRAGAGVRPCSSRTIGNLPPDARGMPRFYVVAGYAQMAGATRSSQLSLWLWNGQAAALLYVTDFNTGGDAEGQGVTVDDDGIRIGSKGHFDALWPCGACDGRQLVHRLKITPANQIVDLGTSSLTPELDVVDKVYSDIRDARPAVDLVSPAARAVMERSWQPMRGNPLRTRLFINAPQTVLHEGAIARLCFAANYDPEQPMSPMLFTFAGGGARLRIVKAEENAALCTLLDRR